MIPGLGCLQILMVVYIICRYRFSFSFSSSFLYFLLWLCRRLMADVDFCSRSLSVILSWLLYLNDLSFPSFSIGRSRYHSFWLFSFYIKVMEPIPHLPVPVWWFYGCSAVPGRAFRFPLLVSVHGVITYLIILSFLAFSLFFCYVNTHFTLQI